MIQDMILEINQDMIQEMKQDIIQDINQYIRHLTSVPSQALHEGKLS